MAAAIDSWIPSFFVYGEAPREYDERTLHFETIESGSSRHHWKINPHVHHTLHQLVFVVRGPGIARTEAEVAQFRPPALIVVPAGTVHGFEFEPGTKGFVVSITGDLLREIARREPNIGELFKGPATLEFQRAALRDTDLRASFRMFAREFARTAPAHGLALEGLLEVMLASVLRLSHRYTDSASATAGRQRLLVQRFRELIESRFRQNASLADYASALNVSESRLRSACLSVTEQSPMQMVHARIVLEAKRQLLYTTLTVSEVAYGLGFDDPAYFTRFFSRRAGVSPRTFRIRQPRG